MKKKVILLMCIAFWLFDFWFQFLFGCWHMTTGLILGQTILILAVILIMIGGQSEQKQKEISDEKNI